MILPAFAGASFEPGTGAVGTPGAPGGPLRLGPEVYFSFILSSFFSAMVGLSKVTMVWRGIDYQLRLIRKSLLSLLISMLSRQHVGITISLGSVVDFVRVLMFSIVNLCAAWVWFPSQTQKENLSNLCRLAVSVHSNATQIERPLRVSLSSKKKISAKMAKGLIPFTLSQNEACIKRDLHFFFVCLSIFYWDHVRIFRSLFQQQSLILQVEFIFILKLSSLTLFEKFRWIFLYFWKNFDIACKVFK